MKVKNPYSLIFGQEPDVLIPRAAQSAYIIDSFCSEKPSQQVFMITGVRGSGKTVFMTQISHKIALMKDWVVVELNPKRDMLTSLGAKLSSDNALAAIFRDARLNLSFFGFGLEVSNTVPITDIETALVKMLASLRRHGRRVLVTIDEVDNSRDVQVFAHSFQIFVREKLPVYLLMTGLYDNINALQNEKTLTFLYRAPKIALDPLNIGTIAENYASVFHLGRAEALAMSRLTKGYSYAFQALGYYTWENDGSYSLAMTAYKQHLDEYVYAKIWSELSKNDRRVVYALACSRNGKVQELREALQMGSNQFAPYRNRLIKKGIINGDEHGYLRFSLPLFERYAEENYWEE